MKSVRAMSDLTLQAERHAVAMLIHELSEHLKEARAYDEWLRKEAERRDATQALSGETQVTDHAVSGFWSGSWAWMWRRQGPRC